MSMNLFLIEAVNHNPKWSRHVVAQDVHDAVAVWKTEVGGTDGEIANDFPDGIVINTVLTFDPSEDAEADQHPYALEFTHGVKWDL